MKTLTIKAVEADDKELSISINHEGFLPMEVVRVLHYLTNEIVTNMYRRPKYTKNGSKRTNKTKAKD
jgi:hypothetical protein